MISALAVSSDLLRTEETLAQAMEALDGEVRDVVTNAPPLTVQKEIRNSGGGKMLNNSGDNTTNSVTV